MRAFLIALTAVVLTVALAACGGSSGSSSSKKGTTTKAGPPTTLTAKGYAALVADIRLTNRKLGPSTLAGRCDRLGKDAYDEEVGAIREVCVTLADILQAAQGISGCAKKTPADPLATRRCIADGLDQVAAYSSDAIDAVKQVAAVNDIAAGPCRDYLIDRRETGRFRDFARTARSVARTLRDSNASQARLQTALTRLQIATKRFERLDRSKAEQLAQAKACRPA